jgi:hypothetical protein
MDNLLFIRTIVGDQHEDGPPDDFLGLVAVVAAADDPVQVLADDGVVGGGDDVRMGLGCVKTFWRAAAIELKAMTGKIESAWARGFMSR